MLDIDKIDVFINHKKIIKDVSFKVYPGSIVGLVGPNGAGKTTIMKTILGLTKFEGSITLDNAPVKENDHKALSRVGALIENPAIYPFLTGKQNLELYGYEASNIDKIVTKLGMGSYIDQKSKGYSLGMKQKLGIAIALLNNPKLVILDEPMNGLDVESTILVRKIIKTMAEKGTAFLISSHVLSELQKVMSQVVLINDGEIIADKDVVEFNELSLKEFKVIPEDYDKIKELLTENVVHFEAEKDGFVIKKEDVYRVQDIIYSDGLHLKEIAPRDDSFEKIIVQLLNKQRMKRHA